jgi:ABC-type transport system involved in cytochrome bd biosynthesis fused ATPase/permease subunit
MMKIASALAALTAALFAIRIVIAYVNQDTVAWFPVLLAAAWLIIAWLFYRQARALKRRQKR